MKVNRILIVMLIFLLCVMKLSAFSPDADGNWKETYSKALCFEKEFPHDDLMMITRFLSRMEAAGEVAQFYSDKWDIGVDDLKAVFYFIMDDSVKETGYDAAAGRINTDTEVFLTKEVVDGSELSIRFDMWYRYTHILPGKRLADMESRIKNSIAADRKLTSDEVVEYRKFLSSFYAYGMTMKCLAAGELELTSVFTLTLIDNYKEFPEGVYLLAVVCRAGNNYKEAETNLDIFLGYMPDSIPAHLDQALNSAMLETGRQNAFMQKALSMQKDSEVSLVLTANVCNMFGLTDYAAQYYEEAVDKFPMNYVPYMMMGQYWLEYGDYEYALELFETALDIGGFGVPEALDLVNVIDELSLMVY